MHSCYTPLFQHLHCGSDDLSIRLYLLLIAYAFPSFLLYLMNPIQGQCGPFVHCYLLLHFLRVYVLLMGRAI